jgi:hypothetical protein
MTTRLEQPRSKDQKTRIVEEDVESHHPAELLWRIFGDVKRCLDMLCLIGVQLFVLPTCFAPASFVLTSYLLFSTVLFPIVWLAFPIGCVYGMARDIPQRLCARNCR